MTELLQFTCSRQFKNENSLRKYIVDRSVRWLHVLRRKTENLPEKPHAVAMIDAKQCDFKRIYFEYAEKHYLAYIWRLRPRFYNEKIIDGYWSVFEEPTEVCEVCEQTQAFVGELHARQECGCKLLCNDCMIRHDKECPDFQSR